MKIIAKKLTAILLSLALAVTFMPMLGQTTYAGNDTDSIETSSKKPWDNNQKEDSIIGDKTSDKSRDIIVEPTDQEPDEMQAVKNTVNKATPADKEDAIKITIGSSVYGTATSEETWYKFKTPGNSKQVYHMELKNRGTGTINCTWPYETSYVSAGEKGGDTCKLAGNTWYYIELYGSNGSSKYTLTVDKIYNVSKKITLGKSVSGTATSAGNIYRFKTLGTSKQLYRIELKNKGSGTTIDSYVWPLAQYFTTYGKGKEAVSVELKGGKWCYVEVRTWYSNPSKYTLKVSKMSDSKRLYLGAKKKAQKLSVGNDRWYRFKTKRSSPYYRITITNKDGGVINYHYTYEYKGRGDHVIPTYNYYNIENFTTEKYYEELPTNKWVYFRISAPKSTARYSIKVSKISDNGGNSLRKAKKIGIGKQKGNIFDSSDEDWFKFVVPASGSYNMRLNQSGDDVYMTFRNADGDEIEKYSLTHIDIWYYGYNNVDWHNLRKGKVYYITIGGYDRKSYSFRIKYLLKKTSIKSLKGKHKGFVVKWKKRSKASGYCIKYSREGNFSNSRTITVKGKNRTSKKISHLKSGKKYYVKVRTYKKIKGKKYYSGWSKKKTVWTK